MARATVTNAWGIGGGGAQPCDYTSQALIDMGRREVAPDRPEEFFSKFVYALKLFAPVLQQQ